MRIALILTLLLASGCVTVLPQSVSESDPLIHWYDITGSTRRERQIPLIIFQSRSPAR